MSEWTQDDDKLVTLAKSARARIGAASGAALRDTTGRTYASAQVDKGALQLSAIELVVGQAAASGATGVEAVVVNGENFKVEELEIEFVAVVGGVNVPIYVVDNDGNIVEKLHT